MDDSSLHKKEELLYKKGNEWRGESQDLTESGRELNLPRSWTHEEALGETARATSSSSFGVKLALFSFSLLVLAATYVGWQFISANNSVLTSKILVLLQTDPLVDGGQDQTLTITVTNENEKAILNAKVSILYEEGLGNEEASRLAKETVTLGTIEPGATLQRTVMYKIYGAEKEKRVITAKLEYGISGTNAPYSKESSIEVILTTPPVLVTVEAEETLLPNEDSRYRFRIKNTTATSSHKLALQVTFPFGFSLTKASVLPTPRSFFWNIPPLPAGKDLVIEVFGKVDGQPGDKTSVRAIVGFPDQETKTVETAFSASVAEMTFSSPSLKVGISSLGGRGDDESLRFGDRTNVTVAYQNTSSSTLVEGDISVLFSGAPLDPLSVTVGNNGYFDSTQGRIIWNGGQTEGLRSIPPQGKGSVTFSFVAPKQIDSSFVSVTSIMRAENRITNLVAQTEFSKVFKLQGSISGKAVSYFDSGAFQNQGPVPPRANKATSYTVSLGVSAQSPMTNAKMVMKLPIYVKWKNSTATDTLAYDSRERQVTWRLGKINATSTYASSFQVEVIPSVTQVGQMPLITSGISLTAIDDSTGKEVADILDGVSTDISDSNALIDAGKVLAP